VPQARHQSRRRSPSGVRVWRDGITDARKLNALEDEKRKLKTLLAESMLEVTTRKEMLGKNF